MENLELIRFEIDELAKSASNAIDIAGTINRSHGTRYSASDIQRLIRGKPPRKKGTGSVSRPQPAGIAKKVGEPIGYMPPLTTTYGGRDPLAIACLEYGLKHGGVMAYDVQSCKIALGRMK